MWDEYLYSIREKVEVRVTVVYVTVLCSVIVLCGMMMKGREKEKPVPAHSLLFSKSTKGAARLNVPIRRIAFTTYIHTAEGFGI